MSLKVKMGPYSSQFVHLKQSSKQSLHIKKGQNVQVKTELHSEVKQFLDELVKNIENNSCIK